MREEVNQARRRSRPERRRTEVVKAGEGETLKIFRRVNGELRIGRCENGYTWGGGRGRCSVIELVTDV